MYLVCRFDPGPPRYDMHWHQASQGGCDAIGRRGPTIAPRLPHRGRPRPAKQSHLTPVAHRGRRPVVGEGEQHHTDGKQWQRWGRGQLLAAGGGKVPIGPDCWPGLGTLPEGFQIVRGRRPG
uniref:Uncharacterized protein n=1 Tax=Myotis myotis TaxID=51298 RepID=A0A7J7XHV9_MYOMY|nr:hypothetical protein mMyoMyo1_011815 [Myotis myotis]